MKTTKNISAILFAALIVTTFSLSAQEDNNTSLGTLITDRPDATESPTAIPKGYLQVETGSFFQSFEKNLLGTGLVVGVDLSKGMLSQAQLKIDKNNWKNIKLIESDAANLTHEVIKVAISDDSIGLFDSAICELGLTAIPNWEKVIDNMIALVKPGGRVVVMDWYMERLSLRGRLINCIGDADITRPTWKYLKERVDGFDLDSKFNRGGVFVAHGFVNGNTHNEYESSVR